MKNVRRTVGPGLSGCAAVVLAAGGAFAQPSFRGLGFLEGYDLTEPSAISADGVFVVGHCANTQTNKNRAFRWSEHAGMQDLGELPGGDDYSSAQSVSAHGFHITGDSDSANGTEPFRWQNGSMTGVGDLAGDPFQSFAGGISSDGFVIVGTGNLNGTQVGFRSYRGGLPESLGDLAGQEDVTSGAEACSADGAVIVGSATVGGVSRAMRWTRASGIVTVDDLPGGEGSGGYAMSADGTVVVGYASVGQTAEAFRWTAATGTVSLGNLPGATNASEAYAASADGSVVVGYGGSDDDGAIIWDAQHGLRSIRDVLIDAGLQEEIEGWTFVYGLGVSGDGKTIVGAARNPDGKFEGWIARLGEAEGRATERVSISATEQQGNGGSTLGSVSASGQIVCFWSNATNLVAGDTNLKSDVFVRNRGAQFTTRVSIASGTNGAQANGDSLNGQVSGNGNFVVFSSDATNLVPGDTNGKRDIFIRDRSAGTTARLSTTSAGVQANGASDFARVSANGRFVVFQSDATNLVAGDSNGKTDIFLKDRQTGATTRVSVSSAGAQGNGRSFDATVSDDGQAVCFTSDATNLEAGDTNSAPDIFFRNRAINKTVRASVSTEGVCGNKASIAARISANGRYIAFTSSANNLYPSDTNSADDIFVRDRFNATTMRISMAPNQANGASAVGAISANGRFVLYTSEATNLVKDDTNGVRDAFLHDGWAFTTERVSLGMPDQQAGAACIGTALSADGTMAMFNSLAGNLVAGDTNGKSDVFLRDLAPQQ